MTPSDDATSQAELIRDGHISAREAVEAALAKITAQDHNLNAFITVDADGALEQADRLDAARSAGEALGPLHGLPVAIKDVTATAGLRTSQGSAIFADNVPEEDALSVARLRRAGAVIIGKTNTPEFAFGAVCTNRLCGPTRNPWDQSRTSGGSSGGSAVAVATGMAALAHGTDFGGSVRMPASFCGVFGLRPTPGTIPEPGRLLGWGQLATEGVLARSTRDAKLMTLAMSGRDPLDPISRDFSPQGRPLPDRLRVACTPDLGGSFPVDAEVRTAFDDARRRLESALGATVDATPDMRGGIDSFKTLRAAESWFRSGEFVEAHEDQLTPSFVWNVRQGRKIDAEAYLRAEATRSRIWRNCIRFFDDHDVLVMPSCAVLPFPNEQGEVLEVGGQKLDSIIDYLACTFLISLIGFPALSVPVPRGAGELPFGLQLVVPPGKEGLLFAVAEQLEAHGFCFRSPPIA